MSIFDLSIKRPVFISMVIIGLVVFGVFAFPKIGLDLFPGVEPPVATVLTIYPGANPESVETEVTKKIEDALSELSGVDELRSVSVENVSQVVIIFDFDIDADKAIQDVRDKVSRAAGLLPKGAEIPTVEKLDLGAVPILNLLVSGPGRADEITDLADDRVKMPLQGIPGVGAIDIIGGAKKEIKVWVDPQKLEATGLAVTDVINALQANNLEFPGGAFKTEGSEFSVRVDGGLNTVRAISNLPVRDIGGQVVRLRDVSRVEAGIEEQRNIALTNGNRTVTLLVRKQSGTNSVAVARAVKARVKEIGATLPPGWSIKTVADQTLVTEASFNAVWFDLVFGGVLAVLIVFIFLRNLRSTFVSALALPVSVVGTFTFIWLMGFTFNILTMLALTLCIGLLIDDAIVVIENIYRHLELGKPAKQAALEGAKEIGLAVLATTLSIVAVFLPASLTGGMIGIMLGEFGMTVVVAVIISLVVSFTLTPMLSARMLTEQRSNAFYRAIESVLNAIDSHYRRIIGWALTHRAVVMVIVVGIFGATIYTAQFITMNFMPSFDAGRFSVYVKLPAGASLETTEQVTEKVAHAMRNAFPQIDSTVVKVGADSQRTQHKGEVFVQLTDKHVRAQTHTEIIENVRKLLSRRDNRKAFRNADITVKEASPAGDAGNSVSGSAALQFNMRGGELEQIETAANRMVRELKQIPGFADVGMSYEGGKPEMQVVVDHERAAGLGVPTAMVGQTVRALVGGTEASKLRQGGDEYDVRVRLSKSFRQGADQIGGLKVRSATTGQLVDLNSVARVEPKTGPSQIDRQARQRQITVYANLEGGLALSSAQNIVEQTAKRIVPPTITTDWGGNARVLGKSVSDFGTAMLLAVILIYMVLAAQFESWLHPLTIMASLPLSVIGAFIAILLTGGSMSMISMIGMLMLMGLVTKNAILLVDYTNTLRRRDGMSRDDALLKAGPTRLRPILMTTLAMIFGMVPVAISDGWGAELRAPMAVAVIGGLIASTLLTLVVVPVIYTFFDALGLFLARIFGAGKIAAETAPELATSVKSTEATTVATEISK